MQVIFSTHGSNAECPDVQRKLTARCPGHRTVEHSDLEAELVASLRQLLNKVERDGPDNRVTNPDDEWGLACARAHAAIAKAEGR